MMSIEIRVNGALVAWFDVTNVGAPDDIDPATDDTRGYEIRRNGARQLEGMVFHHRSDGAVALAAQVFEVVTP